MGNFIISSEGTKKSGFIDGYIDQVKHASPNMLSKPSQNCYADIRGNARTRPGYLDTGFDLAEANKASFPFYSKRWNVIFFSINGKVKFVDRNNSNNVVDTGLVLTATETTTFGEYAGDIYLTNQTDGLRQIHMGRVNETTATSGDSNIKVDQHLAGRLLAFGDGSGTLRIANTTPFEESYSSVAGTGVITLSNTLNADVPDNTIVYTVEDISSNKPFGSHLTFWKERMIVWGVIDDQATYNGTSVDNATNVVYMSKFAIRDILENVIDFDTSSTATIEQIGKGGVVTDILATRDYLYIWTETETYFANVADVNKITGATIPQLLTNQHGAIAPRSSADLGNGKITFITPDKRIMGIGIATENGAPVVFPIEGFDTNIKDTLKGMNNDQTGLRVFYHKGEKRCFYQVRINSAWTTFVYDNNIEKFQPPWLNYVFSGYFEIDGVLFTTALNDDTVYEVGASSNDDGIEIQTIMATGRFEFEDGRVTSEWQEVELSGEMTKPTEITVTYPVGGVSDSNKTISSEGLNFESGAPIGDRGMGDETIGGEQSIISAFAEWDERFAIYDYGGDVQIQLETVGDGAAIVWSSFRIRARSLDRSLLTLN